MTSEAGVQAAIRAVLDDAYRLYANVRWISRPGQDGPARDGETDPVIVRPEDGLLVVETKGGLIRRDGQGRWWSGVHALSTPPFRQAETSKHALVRLLAELPDWPGREADIRAGHAVAFRDVDLATSAVVRAWMERVYGYWKGDGRRGRAFGAAELALMRSASGHRRWSCARPCAGAWTRASRRSSRSRAASTTCWTRSGASGARARRALWRSHSPGLAPGA